VIPPLMDRASPLRTTHLRDPYGPPILFGSESFMDEVAAATNTDPVAFRLRYLTLPVNVKQWSWQRRNMAGTPARHRATISATQR
jgi:hypothetical protein